jgi:hypothetical protein
MIPVPAALHMLCATASNAVASSDSFPVYVTGSTITVTWTADRTYGPLDIVLRTGWDGILRPTSGVDGNILCTYVYFLSSDPKFYE